MRTSSNPAFRNLPSSGGYASFQHGGQAAGYDPYPSAPPTAERPITADDVVMKTAASLAVVIVAGVLTAMSGGAMYALALPAALVGIGIAIFMCFRPKPSAALTLIYSAAQGIVLGALTGLFESIPQMKGIGVQALIGTAAVFLGMLIVYKTGAIRVTPRLTKMIVAGVIGAAVLMLANMLVGFFVPGGLGIRNGWLGIGIGLLFIVIAAFTLLLEFDQADEMVRAGYPAKWAWFTAFGLVASLVWLYVEILRLLYLLRQE
ncbi:Bax inhibitor-1/YccA family protein [Allokutzneria sp. NRRL B-24872]|uniref:Bax inhibitor-1/YccA family protein n=1 Tax=Allokutzneria sp. NRRL B-24872 TaxID=1137961 RepID=UPI000A3B3DCA|nr:Bax inhibitor-1/YccA family protein [Allokutzneria sp. NRRL B-24872]